MRRRAADANLALNSRELKFSASSRIGMEHTRHLAERGPMLSDRLRGDAIARNEEAQATQIRIAGSEINAAVGGESADDQRARAEVLQQQAETGLVERGMARLQYEVVLAGRCKELSYRPALRARTNVLDLLLEVRSPASKVVIDVDAWDASSARAFPQLGELRRYGSRGLQQAPSTGKFEIVDHVDENERDCAVIWRVAVQILLVVRKR